MITFIKNITLTKHSPQKVRIKKIFLHVSQIQQFRNIKTCCVTNTVKFGNCFITKTTNIKIIVFLIQRDIHKSLIEYLL